MQSLIQLLVYLVIFAVVAWGLWWVCVHFGMPQPVVWIVGAILLIVILLFISSQVGGGSVNIFPRRN